MGIWLSENRAVLDKLKKERSWEFMLDEEFIFCPVKTPFRGADVQFNYLNGSVFIDFRRSISGQLYLAIISFDCYGACDVAAQRELGDELTTLLDREWQKTTCDTDKLWLAMKEVIAIKKDQIWSDALQDYGLL